MDPDELAIRGAQGGDAGAQAEILRRHSRALRHLVARLGGRDRDVEDQMQDLYEKVLVALPRFRVSGRRGLRRTLVELEKKKGGLPARHATGSSSASVAATPISPATPGPVVVEPNEAKAGSNAPNETMDEPAAALDPRKIPIAVIRAVWSRDGGCCAFVGTNGRRCGSTRQLEVHHRQAAALGGPPTLTNLGLFCKAHNGFAAEQDFGALFMSQFARRR